MIWYEVMDDLGDGTSAARRFRTKEEALIWRADRENDPCFQQDGDGSPVYKVDTDSPFFFHSDD